MLGEDVIDVEGWRVVLGKNIMEVEEEAGPGRIQVRIEIGNQFLKKMS